MSRLRRKDRLLPSENGRFRLSFLRGNNGEEKNGKVLNRGEGGDKVMNVQPVDFAYYKTAWFFISVVLALVLAPIGAGWLE